MFLRADPELRRPIRLLTPGGVEEIGTCYTRKVLRLECSVGECADEQGASDPHRHRGLDI